MLFFPLDVKIQILLYLPLSDVLNLKTLSKYYFGLLEEYKTHDKKLNFLWEGLIKRDYPKSTIFEKWKKLSNHKIYKELFKSSKSSLEKTRYFYDKREYNFNTELSENETIQNVYDNHLYIFFQNQVFLPLEIKENECVFDNFDYYLIIEHVFVKDWKEKIPFFGYKSVLIPKYNFREYELVDIDGNHAVVLDEKSELKEYRLPNGDNGEEIKSMFESGKFIIMKIINIAGEEEIHSIKEFHN